MKLLRYGPTGAEKPGMLDGAGTIRDLSAVVADLTPTAIGPDGLYRLREIDPNSLPRVEGDPRIGAPLSGIGKIVAIGLNYRSEEHTSELQSLMRISYAVFCLKKKQCTT